MAKQIGTHRLVGTTGNMTYVKTKDGFLVREKPVRNKTKFRTSENFARVRDHAANFGHAAKSGKLLRTAFIGQIKTASDYRVTSRFTTRLLEIVKSDPVNERGERRIQEGELQRLQGFEFNNSCQLSEVLHHVQYTTTIDQATGVHKITVAPFAPTDDIAVPAGASHARLTMAAAVVDFDRGIFVSNAQSTADLPLDVAITEPITLSVQLPAQSTLPLFMVFGIRFFETDRDKQFPLPKDANALQVVYAGRNA